MTNRGTARRMNIHQKIIEKKVLLKPTHEERHPNDKDVRNPDKCVNYGLVKTKIKTHNLSLVVAWSTIYNTLEIGDVCPKCERKGKKGTIIWKGETKHRPLHPRCNNGCLLIYTGEESIIVEEEE